MSFSASDAPAPPPSRGHRWVWWTLGGCGTLVVLAIAAVVVVAVVIAHSAGSSGNCLPAGFPVAPGLTKVTTIQLGRTCTTAYRTGESPGSVEAYYATALDQNGWQVTTQSGGTIRFRRADRAGEAGTVSVSTGRGRTQVAVVLRNA